MSGWLLLLPPLLAAVVLGLPALLRHMTTQARFVGWVKPYCVDGLIERRYLTVTRGWVVETYRGRSVFWHRVPDGKSAGTSLDLWFADIYKRETWKVTP